MNHTHNIDGELEVGKIPPDMLTDIVFKRTGKPRKEILVRPGIGQDAAVLDLGRELLVASTDPITGAQDMVGWLAVKVALNDIGACGGEPVCLLLTLLLPPGAKVSDLTKIMDDVDAACCEENVQVAGGHTEVTPGISKPIVSVTALGRSRGGRVLRPEDAEAGQDLVLTKWAGMEGTSVLVRDFPGVFDGVLDPEEIQAARDLMFDISVTKDGFIAWQQGASCGHDVTEGGVLGAVYELCKAASLGAKVYADKIPMLGVTRKVASFGGIDPLGLVSSGCLLVATSDGQGLCRAYEASGINAAVVGKLKVGDSYLLRDGRRLPLQAPGADELWRARENLQKRLGQDLP